jgi:GntR family transcriptional regulator
VLPDRTSPVPLYAQVKQIVEERLASGVWQPGTLIPSETELCRQFGVSRITVRQALGELVKEGRLTRLAGRGTFITQPRIEQPLAKLTGFSQDMSARGQRPGSRVLHSAVIPAPAAISGKLKIAPGEEVIVLRRLRLADGEPVAIETTHLRSRLCPGLLSEPLDNQSLYHILSEKHGINPTRAEQQMEAIACPEAEARLLLLKRNSPVLHIYRTTYGLDDTPFEWVESFYRGDKYIFYVELRGECI